MENILFNIGLIKMAGINGLAIDPSVSLSYCCVTRHFLRRGNYLAELNVHGRNVQYLDGPRDYTMLEVTRILGRAIGEPELKYVDIPAAVLRKGLVESGGLSPDAADPLI